MPNNFEDRYRKMSDEELLEIADSGADMIPEAEAAFLAELSGRQILDEAMERRRLAQEALVRRDVVQTGDPPVQEPEPDDGESESLGDGVLEGRELVVIDRFRDLFAAQLAQGALKSAGINSVLRDENMVRLDWFVSNCIGGIRLSVEPKDVHAALEIIESATPASIDTGEGTPYVHTACPRCGSTETIFEEIDKRWAGAGLWFKIPVTIPRNEWYCEKCGNHWKQERE